MNPEGISTNAETVGIVEGDIISKYINKKLISENITMPHRKFAERIEKVTCMTLGRAADRYSEVNRALCELQSVSHTR